MKRLVLTLFLLAFALWVNAFLGGRVYEVFNSSATTFPITFDLRNNRCLNQIEVYNIDGGSGPLIYELSNRNTSNNSWESPV
jgi:hypothetical protein